MGSKITSVLGGTTNNVAKAVHLSFCIMPDSNNEPSTTYSELESAGIERAKWSQSIGSAYALENATRPSTIGLVLTSSSLALLSWVGERFLEWTDEDPDIYTTLAYVTLCWLSDCASTCLWPYRQLFTPGVVGAHENTEWYIRKPLGFPWFPKEIAPVPRG